MAKIKQFLYDGFLLNYTNEVVNSDKPIIGFYFDRLGFPKSIQRKSIFGDIIINAKNTPKTDPADIEKKNWEDAVYNLFHQQSKINLDIKYHPESDFLHILIFDKRIKDTLNSREPIIRVQGTGREFVYAKAYTELSNYISKNIKKTNDINEATCDLIVNLDYNFGTGFSRDLPLMQEFGLDPKDSQSSTIYQFIYNARDAAERWPEYGAQSHSYGFCSAMLEYGVISEDDIKKAISVYKNRDHQIN